MHIIVLGTLAKQAIINLQKIVLATGSSGLGAGSVPSTQATNTGGDAPASKRRRVWVNYSMAIQSCFNIMIWFFL